MHQENSAAEVDTVTSHTQKILKLQNETRSSVETRLNSPPSLPVLHVGVILSHASPTRNQGMRVPIIAVIRSGGRTQRPGDLGSHVAKDILGEGDKIRAVGGIRVAKVQCAMGRVLARDNMAAHGSGARFDYGGGTRPGTLLGRKAFALDHRAFTVPEAIWLSGLVHVVFEDHSREVAVAVRILTVIASKIGEVLHVDLDGGCADAIAVILVEPGAGGFVAVVTDDDVRICPI